MARSCPTRRVSVLGGSEVGLEGGDDGRCLDREAIRQRGEQRGLVRADAVLADSDLDALIFEPGFSTVDEVSRLAGRGVGMDVVACEVRQLGGTLDIASRKGEGTTFTLRLRSEEHTSTPVTNAHLVCRLLLEKKN